MSKGSKQRPRQVSRKQYNRRYDRTFRAVECKCTGIGNQGCPAHDELYLSVEE